MTLEQMVSIVTIFGTIITVFSVIIGGLFALIKWNESNKIRKAEFFNEIIVKLRFDKDMVMTRYKIAYGRPWYTSKFHTGITDTEYSIDKLLSYLSYICYLKETKNINDKEFLVLQYEIARTCASRQVMAYLWNLYHFSKSKGLKCSFEHLIMFGIKNNFLDKDILNEDSVKFRKHKRLEF